MPLFNEAAHQALLRPVLAAIHTPETAWANGCQHCTQGLVNPPELRRDRPLYQERLTQFRFGHLQFCNCDAGQAYRSYVTGAADRQHQEDSEMADLPRRMAEQRLSRLFDSAGVPGKYAEFTLAGFERLAGADPGKRDAVTILRHYEQHGFATQHGERKSGIVFWGVPSTGKTGSLAPLFTHMVRQGNSGLWVQYNQLMAEMRRFEDGQVDERMAACQTVDYLFIDDLGDPAAQKTATDYARDVLFRIIDHRTSRNMPNFVTTNLSPQELADQFHQRIARRLLAACAVVNMGGRILR